MCVWFYIQWQKKPNSDPWSCSKLEISARLKFLTCTCSEWAWIFLRRISDIFQNLWRKTFPVLDIVILFILDFLATELNDTQHHRFLFRLNYIPAKTKKPPLQHKLPCSHRNHFRKNRQMLYLSVRCKWSFPLQHKKCNPKLVSHYTKPLW